MLSTRSNTTVNTEQQRDTRMVPESVAVGDWIRETTIGNRTTKEHLYTVNATVYRVKNSSKFIDIVKKSLESSDCKPGDQVALYSRKRGRLLAKAEIAVLETGAKVQDIDSREKTSSARRSLEKGGAKIAIVETQSDLDRLLKLVDRRKPEALEKIIVLGKGVTAPEAHKDLVVFASKIGKKADGARKEIEARRVTPEKGEPREPIAQAMRRESLRPTPESTRRDIPSVPLTNDASGLELLRAPSLEKILSTGRRDSAVERSERSPRKSRDEISVEDLRAAGIPSIRLDDRTRQENGSPELVLSVRPDAERSESLKDGASPRRRIKSREELRRGRRAAEPAEKITEESPSIALERRSIPDATSLVYGAAAQTALPAEWASVSLPTIDRAAFKASVANMDDRRDEKRGTARTVEDRFVARPIEQIVESLREVAQEASAMPVRSEPETNRSEPAAHAMRLPELDSEPAAEPAAEPTMPSGRILRLARAA